jgi:hypothetical protein
MARDAVPGDIKKTGGHKTGSRKTGMADNLPAPVEAGFIAAIPGSIVHQCNKCDPQVAAS